MKIDADGNRVECTDEDLVSIEKTHKDSAEWVKMPNKRSWVKHCLVSSLVWTNERYAFSFCMLVKKVARNFVQELIDRLKKHRNEFAWFSHPVDWKKMGLTDYPKIVQKPMDFSTLEDKVRLLRFFPSLSLRDTRVESPST